MEGTVKWFNRTKGYGFIAGEDGNEYFVHHSAIKDGFIRDNDRVSFEPAETDKGKQAREITLLQKGSEIASDNDSDSSAEEDEAPTYDEEPSDEADEEEDKEE